MEKRIIPISLPVTGEEEWEALKEPLNTGWLTTGPKVQAFEKAFAEIHQVRHAIAVTSCTSALHLALVSLDIKPGDEVIVPAFTWISTANAVSYLGAKVVFCDINIRTYNIDSNKLKEKITPRTRAIMVVHLFGLCADMKKIKEVSGDIHLIEDAACAAGSAYYGNPAGGMGKIGCFSFHPRKSITTGEGGMITTNDNDLAKTIKSLRNHGASIPEDQIIKGQKPYLLPDFKILGYNYRMTDLQGALGIVQLKKLSNMIAERSRWAAFYRNKLANISWLSLPDCTDKYKHGWQSFVILIDESKSPFSRNKIIDILQKKGISTRPGTHAIHMLHYYSKKYYLSPDDFPYAKIANDQSIAIPLHNKMVKEDFEYVIYCIKNIKK